MPSKYGIKERSTAHSYLVCLQTISSGEQVEQVEWRIRHALGSLVEYCSKHIFEAPNRDGRLLEKVCGEVVAKQPKTQNS